MIILVAITRNTSHGELAQSGVVILHEKSTLRLNKQACSHSFCTHA